VAVDPQRAAENPRVPPELPPPVTVTQHDDRVPTATHVVLGAQGPTQGGAQAQEGEVGAGDYLLTSPLPHVPVVGNGKGGEGEYVQVQVEVHQFLRGLLEALAEEEPLHEAEDGGVGPDSKGHGEERDGREPRASKHAPESVPEVAGKGVHGDPLRWLAW